MIILALSIKSKVTEESSLNQFFLHFPTAKSYNPISLKNPKISHSGLGKIFLLLFFLICICIYIHTGTNEVLQCISASQMTVCADVLISDLLPTVL